MNDDVLNILLENPDSFISGEKISDKLGISRAAVWKHINQLKSHGYSIVAVNNKGYRIEAIPDEISTARINRLLEPGINIVYVESVDSTNAYASMLAEQGAQALTAVIAASQSGGRGRRGRSWVSPKGGLWMSVITRPTLEPSCVQALTLCAALAVIQGIKELHPEIDPKIKWPNDILVGDRKLCGILSEMSSDMDHVRHIVTGIGINANFNSEILGSDLNTLPISLLDITNSITDRNKLAAAVLNSFSDIYAKFEVTGSFDPFVNEYVNNMAWLGEQASLTGQGEPGSGIIKGIDSTGALLLDSGVNIERVIAGEISLRRFNQ